MSASQNHRDEKQTPPDKSTVVLLLSTLGDTTWRMFLPTIGFTILGIFGDRTFGVKPWLTIAGVLLGATVAGVLIRKQMKKANEQA